MAMPLFLTKYKLIFGVALIVVLAAIPSVYFYQQYQAAQFRANNPAEAQKLEAQETIVAVGKMLQLPTGETPTVAVVTDVSKLLIQPFFVDAQNGDRILLYMNAKKAILYRPSTNKIINVAPLTIGPAATGTPAPTPTSATTPAAKKR